MFVSAIHVQHLPKFEYFQLPVSVRSVARQAVMDIALDGLHRSITSTRQRASQNVNLLVNDQHHVVRLVRHLRDIRSYVDVSRFEKMIAGNLCHFLEDGSYVRYIH